MGGTLVREYLGFPVSLRSLGKRKDFSEDGVWIIFKMAGLLETEGLRWNLMWERERGIKRERESE